jgi:hypothetical protein
MNKLLLALILTLPAYPAFAELSAPEQALVQKCQDNIDPGKKQLSPVTADECVKGLNAGEPEPLLKKLAAEDAEAAGRVLGYNNALLDLKGIVVKQKGIPLAQALVRVLEKSNCTLCEMGLGADPESIFEWVDTNAGARAEEVKRGVRTWDALGPVRTRSLSSAAYGKDKDSWTTLDIMSRYSELSTWAQKETDNLVAAAGLAAKNPAAGADTAALIAVLREDLVFSEDAPYRAKLDALGVKAAAKPSAADAAKPSAADKKARELAAAGGSLGAMSARNLGDQNEYLGQTFDNATAAKAAALTGTGTGAGQASVKPGAAAVPAAPVKMTAAQETELANKMIRTEKGQIKGELADVMAQTEAGKRTIAFYGDKKFEKAGSNKLDFGFTREPGVFGYWDPDAKVIKINTEVAEEFAAKRGLTPAQLLKDPAAMKDLAVYISPTFVHESEHQNQTARAIDQGIDYKKFTNGSSDPYTRAKENLSNKWSAEQMIEYCSKNGGAGCFAKYNPMHADNADKYMQGGLAALDTLKAPLYPRIDGFEGGTAREFKMAQTAAKELKTLEAKQKATPAAMTEEERQDLKDYREMMDTRFKWYTVSYRENADAERDALAFRKQYSSSGLGLTMPEAL